MTVAILCSTNGWWSQDSDASNQSFVTLFTFATYAILELLEWSLYIRSIRSFNNTYKVIDLTLLGTRLLVAYSHVYFYNQGAEKAKKDTLQKRNFRESMF